MSRRKKLPSEPKQLLSCHTFGVGHHTEGVSLLLHLGKHRLLLDCGLGELQPLLKDSQPPVELVFCSHAHQDHALGLLEFHQTFPEIPIYTSEVTAKLLPLNWLERELSLIPSFCQVLPWRSPIQLDRDLSVELFPAGHLPGAAAILLNYTTSQRTYKIFYTGDFCLSNLQLVDGLSLENLRGLAPDVLIIEGTYGTARHPHRRQQEKQLMGKLDEAIARGKNILLPVPTFGLGQEILKLLRSHHRFTGKNLDIWVDGNLALACDLYLELMAHFPQSVQNFARYQPLFWDDKILPRMRRITPEIERSQLGKSSCIVLSDRLTYLEEYWHLEGASWLILVPEQSKIRKNPLLSQFISQSNSERISLETYLLAEHSDGRNTTQLIHNLRPQHVIFVHGAPNYLADLTSLEELQTRYQLHSPPAGITVELPIGEQFIQTAVPPPNTYEGELNETGAFVTITLPEQINRDPRWQNFADTGLVEACWQGEELVFRGLSQRELLQQSNLSPHQLELVECCKNCFYYQSQSCTNPSSPLYGFKVTPKGSCPVFEPVVGYCER
jgi:Cft2 family RNA processing exonuclease